MYGNIIDHQHHCGGMWLLLLLLLCMVVVGAKFGCAEEAFEFYFLKVCKFNFGPRPLVLSYLSLSFRERHDKTYTIHVYSSMMINVATF
jgi:hypothetical protein